VEDGAVIRLLLVDDQPAVRRGLRMWLALEPDFVVVGECSGGSQVCPLVGALHPDVVLMDLEMSGIDCFAMTEQVRAARPDLPVVLLGLHDDIEVRARAWLAGASAFVTKRDAPPALLSALRAVAHSRNVPRGP
jgi:DNA-binding NarL/FixJ family response regulator